MNEEKNVKDPILFLSVTGQVFEIEPMDITDTIDIEGLIQRLSENRDTAISLLGSKIRGDKNEPGDISDSLRDYINGVGLDISYDNIPKDSLLIGILTDIINLTSSIIRRTEVDYLMYTIKNIMSVESPFNPVMCGLDLAHIDDDLDGLISDDREHFEHSCSCSDSSESTHECKCGGNCKCKNDSIDQ